MRFFGHFLDFSRIQKVKKTSKWTEKNEHQHFFNVFRKMKAYVVWHFSKIKRSFFSVHFWTVFNPRGDALASF